MAALATPLVENWGRKLCIPINSFGSPFVSPRQTLWEPGQSTGYVMIAKKDLNALYYPQIASYTLLSSVTRHSAK